MYVQRQSYAHVHERVYRKSPIVTTIEATLHSPINNTHTPVHMSLHHVASHIYMYIPA